MDLEWWTRKRLYESPHARAIIPQLYKVVSFDAPNADAAIDRMFAMAGMTHEQRDEPETFI